MSLSVSHLSRKYGWPEDERSQRVLSYIVQRATELMDVKKIILYGSRARGDFNEHSDYDLAFDISDDKENWSRFFLEVPDNLETFLGIDLLRLDEIGEPLRSNIQRDGKVIYAGE